ncbi:MAG: tRNA pseudouridine(38-40) synthase TruA [Clostridia bacterium]
MKYKLVIEYDGSSFHGWQSHAGMICVQTEIEKALKQVLHEDIIISGSGRTDKGVHAHGQVASFDTKINIPSTYTFMRSLNHFLPETIQILSVQQVDDEFDARFSAKRKTYRYYFYKSKIEKPLKKGRALRINENVSIEKMREEVQALVGEFNFASFVASGSGKTNFVREIYSACVIETEPNEYYFEITGNGFLYNMVRIIVGTLIDIASAKISYSMREIIEFQNRTKAGKTAPSYGLYLEKVDYSL